MNVTCILTDVRNIFPAELLILKNLIHLTMNTLP